MTSEVPAISADLVAKDARAAALDAVLAVLAGRALDAQLRSLRLVDARDRALASELSHGVCRWYGRLDALVAGLLRRPLKRRDRDIHVLLLLGAYQLLYSRIPPHAALSATVELSKRLGKPWASGLINGVLRRLQREQKALAAKVDQDEAVAFAHPRWLYDSLRTAWPEDYAAILGAAQSRPPMTLRVDTEQVSRADYAAALADAGLSASRHPHVPTALVLERAVDVTELPGFASGKVSVQDAGAQRAAALLNLSPGQRVLDACAAPGGKTLHLLQQCPDINLDAADIDPDRLQRVAENLARGGHQARLIAADVADPNAELEPQYDRILLDAPCSATGVMRRHPDIRLLRRGSDIAMLIARQGELLTQLWRRLRPGGRLLYVTCSVLPAENAEQVDRFLSDHPEARPADLSGRPGRVRGKGVQLLPGVHETDGFFYAALDRPAGADQ